MQFRDKKVTLLGLGRSSVAAARLLQTHGAIPFVSDVGEGAALAPYKAQLDACGIAYETGGHSDRALSGPDTVVLSPGIPAALSLLRPLREAGVPILGELELASRFYHGVIFAVTGTNGKTTTTRLLEHLIRHTGHKVALAGNNETPFSAVAQADTHPDYVVLEVSSYQLETTAQFHPHFAAVLNLTPDHLERHGNLAGYAAAKRRIFMQQTADDYAVLNYDDPVVRDMASASVAQAHYFSLEQPPLQGLWVDGGAIRDERGATLAYCEDVTLPGRHNLANALAALTLMRAGGFAWEQVLEGLRRFVAVEHRIEPVARIHGVQFYNDSKSTNIDSLRVALESFDAPLTLIAGGQGKGSDYSVLRELVQQKVACLVTLGADAPKFEAAFDGLTLIERADSMRDAVARAYTQALRLTGGETPVVLLSPGCASFDMYLNFEARGEDFKTIVRDLACAEAPAIVEGTEQ